MVVWAQLSHPNVARFLGYVVDLERKEAWFITPWMRRGSVKHFLDQHPNTSKIDRLRLVRILRLHYALLRI